MLTMKYGPKSVGRSSVPKYPAIAQQQLLSRSACSKCLPPSIQKQYLYLKRLKSNSRIPDYSEATYLANICPEQAVEAPHNFSSEIEALSLLTKAGCSCTPSLYDWKKDKQTDQEPVPGGYKLFILMELLPGIMPEDLFFSEDSEDGAREERDELRSAFKKSWL